SPFSAAFLLPSGLYLPYALAPWLLVSFVHGARREQPLRWAAVFALAVFVAGTNDPPGIAYASLPLIPMAVYLVHVERSARWRAVLGWTVVTAVLTLAVSAAALVKVTTGAAAYARRLAETEAPENANVASSWAETWRGLGFWLSYIRDRTGLQRPQTAAYFTNVPLVVATFVPGCVALFAVWRSRWRPRLAFGAMMLTSLVVMVGSYGRGSTPYGRLLLSAYSNVSWLGGLRASYKAGAGLAMGLAALFALGATSLPPSVTQRFRQQWLPTAVAAGLIAVVSYPFWTGHLYPEQQRMDSAIPGYWKDALAYLDGNNDGTRVLVLPGSTRTAYRWGYAGDDMFDALLRRPHVVPSGVPLSNPEAANVVASLADRAGSSRYVPGTLAPTARRLGIGVIVIRNDLDWERMRQPRPSRFEALRTDPDLVRIASFGRPGSNVLAPEDKSLAVFAEAKLPPVEIYAVRDPVAPVRAQRAAPPVLVSGGGDAWTQLAARGLLSTAGAVTYTADLTAEATNAAITSGSPVTVTDTNRRRLTLLTGNAPTSSHTLATGEDLGRQTPSLFARAGSQSVAWFPSATRVYSSSPSSLDGFQPAFRAANAFDGDPRTAWWTAGGAAKGVGGWVRADLRTPTEVSRVEVEIAEPLGPARRPSRVSVGLSDGSSTPIALVDGVGAAEFRPRTTSSLEIRIEAVEGDGLAAVGLREVRVNGLDLQERIQLPDDLLRAGARVPALATALETAQVAYQFERAAADGAAEEEVALRRRFRTVGTRSYRATGEIRLDPTTSDQVVDAVVGGPIGAYGSSRMGGLLANRGGQAVDGRLDTGWIAEAEEGAQLTIRFPERVVDHIDVVTPANDQFSTVTEVKATVGEQSVVIPLAQTAECVRRPGAPPSPLCLTRGLVGIPPTVASQVTIEVTGVEPRAGGGFGPRPIEIIEVYWDFAGNAAAPAADAPVEGCTNAVATIDGQPLPLRIEATYEQLLQGEPVRVSGCADPTLAPGWHEVNGDGQARVGSLRLETAAPPQLPTATEARLAVVSVPSSPTRMTARFVADGPTFVTTGESYDAGWRATVNGRSIGPPRAGDTLSTWVVDEQGEVVVEMQFRPDRDYSTALAVSLGAAAVCLVLVLWRGRRD
ncbi:MAG: arabinofuranan 3-O-arabinosyltransferase, partial [Actinomycetota bacterium]